MGRDAAGAGASGGVPAAEVERLSERLSLVADLRLPHAMESRGDAVTCGEKKDHLASLLQRDPAVFLERYGGLLREEELGAFDGMAGDYEIAWHMRRLRPAGHPSSPHPSHATVVKNRRLAFLTRLEREGLFFSEEAMRERDPLLHQDYMGGFGRAPGGGAAGGAEEGADEIAIQQALVRGRRGREGEARGRGRGAQMVEEEEEEEDEEEDEEEEEEEEDEDMNDAERGLRDHGGRDASRGEHMGHARMECGGQEGGGGRIRNAAHVRLQQEPAVLLSSQIPAEGAGGHVALVEAAAAAAEAGAAEGAAAEAESRAGAGGSKGEGDDGRGREGGGGGEGVGSGGRRGVVGDSGRHAGEARGQAEVQEGRGDMRGDAAAGKRKEEEEEEREGQGGQEGQEGQEGWEGQEGREGALEDLRWAMKERFLAGREAEVDYGRIDGDESLDDDWMVEANRDAEERYFGED
ncbi:hypothetical protein CLOP_g10607 [Closterium sp. NIES-67]|nr:hypothetical protein CLOP_g10607 [Closterium sp. NIES-67]